MTSFSHGAIAEIRTADPSVHAFRITGHVEDDDMEEMAEHMNRVFDAAGDAKVSMLLDLSGMTGRDLDAFLDGDVIRAQLRAWSSVDKYAVVGAPSRAAKMIEWADKVIPVDARAFDTAAPAWEFVGTTEVPSAPAVAAQSEAASKLG